MSDTKMLQAILNGQVALREDLGGQIQEVKKELNRLEIKIDKNTDRLDKIGSQLAYVEDDTPTREEFESLDKRVLILEKNPRN